ILFVQTRVVVDKSCYEFSLPIKICVLIFFHHHRNAIFEITTGVELGFQQCITVLFNVTTFRFFVKPNGNLAVDKKTKYPSKKEKSETPHRKSIYKKKVYQRKPFCGSPAQFCI